MEYEVIMNKLIQIALVGVAGVVYLINQIDGAIITKAFDQLFSIGLLLILAIMLYREWKSSQAYNEKRDQRLERIIENNTEAMNSFRREVKSIHQRIDRNSTRIDNLDQ